MCLYSNALVLTSSSKAKEQFHPTSLISMFTFCIFVMQGIETIVEPANQSSKRKNSTCMHHHSSCKIRWQRRTLGARMLTHPASSCHMHACGKKTGHICEQCNAPAWTPCWLEEGNQARNKTGRAEHSTESCVRKTPACYSLAPKLDFLTRAIAPQNVAKTDRWEQKPSTMFKNSTVNNILNHIR